MKFEIMTEHPERRLVAEADDMEGARLAKRVCSEEEGEPLEILASEEATVAWAAALLDDARWS